MRNHPGLNWLCFYISLLWDNLRAAAISDTFCVNWQFGRNMETCHRVTHLTLGNYFILNILFLNYVNIKLFLDKCHTIVQFYPFWYLPSSVGMDYGEYNGIITTGCSKVNDRNWMVISQPQRHLGSSSRKEKFTYTWTFWYF